MKNILILYEDDFSLIISKPAGLAVQGGKGVKSSLDKILSEYCSQNGGSQALLVHRLDKDTSGELLAAKGQEAARRFSRIFGTERKAVKLYTAVCAGRPKQAEGVITDKLMIHGKEKESKTFYKVIKTFTAADCVAADCAAADCAEDAVIGFDYSVLEIELGTGRMHQIRRHLAMNENPILGDDKYGDFSLNRKLYKSAGLKRLLLHASRLIIKELKIDVIAPLPEYFNRWVPAP